MADAKPLALSKEGFEGRGGSAMEDEEEAMEVEVKPGRNFSDRLVLMKQLRALFLKDLTLQSRAIGTNVCQLLTPIVFISFVGIMQLILNRILREHATAVPGTTPIYLPMDIGRSVACETNGSAFGNPEIILVQDLFKSSSTYNITNCHDNLLNFYLDFPEANEIISNNSRAAMFRNLSNVTLARPQDLLFQIPMFYIGKADGVDLDLGELSFNGNRSGFIGGAVPSEWRYNFSTNFSIDTHWPLRRNFSGEKYPYTNEHGPFLTVPFFLPSSNLSTLNSRLDTVVRKYNNEAQTSSDYYDNYDRIYVVTPLSRNQFNTTITNIKEAAATEDEKKFEMLKPSGAIFIDSFNQTSSSLDMDYTIVANDLVLYYLNNPYNEDFSAGFDTHQRNNLINMMSNAIFKHLTNLTQEAPVAIATYIMSLPTPLTNLTLDISIILGGILYPYATSFLLPVYMAALVKDKSEKHLIMMEQNGLSRWTYWTVTYIFNYILYVVIAAIIAILSLAFQIRLFTQTNALVLILALFLWGHAQVALGFLFSNFFTSPRAATIIGYLLVFAGVAVALLLEILKIFPDDETPFPVYMFYPPFVFYRILLYMINSCIGYSCYPVSILDPTEGLNVVTTAMLYLGLDTLVILVASMYLSYVLPGEYGVRKSPFFPIIALYKGCRYAITKLTILCGFKSETETEGKLPKLTVQSPVRTEFVDEDVLAEEELLRQGFPPDAPMVIYQLRKEYPGSNGAPPHVAVHSVSVAIQRNECFGLLGPNGAGKTTLISVLTGLYEPTSGTARIAGYDITTEINAVHQHLGVCPQFDIHHADLSAEEHLLFYARLKGVVWRKEKKVVEHALRQVNLYDARKRKSKALSGGMRRRLSIAMALIGQPDILILDEPTTGLDPASRRQVWEVLETVKDGRSVILTTHAMEEADHLCTRIGIMNYGKLRCLGTQTRLKAKFGSGYQLQFHCEKGRSQEVEEFVQTQLPHAIHTETYADLVSFKLERGDLVVSQLFRMFDSARATSGILDWGIKMTTLEDVFLNIVRRNQDEPPPVHRSMCPAWIPCQCCSIAKSDS